MAKSNKKNKISMTNKIFILVLLVILIILIVKLVNNIISKPTLGNEKAVKENIASTKEDIAFQENIKQECKNTYNTYIRNYFSYIFSNKLIGFYDFQFIDDVTKIKNDEMNTYYVKTNIKYNDFKDEILNIVSENYYNTTIAKYVKEKDGMLYMIPGGGFTPYYIDLLKFDIADIDNINFNKVVIDVLEEKRYDDGNPSSTSKGKITFVKEHDKYVLDKLEIDLNEK